MSEIRINCPDAIHVPRTGKSDYKRKLYINTQKGFGHCFRCGFKTRNAAELIERFDLSIEIDFQDQVDTPTVQLHLPTEYRTDFWSTHGTIALQYLKSRDIPEAVILDYSLGFCTEGRYAGRIIIPFFRNGDLVYFQARDYTNSCKLKYDSPSKSEGAVPNVLFNLDRAAKTGVVLLVEGPLDALRIPKYGVAVVGCTWNDAKQRALLSCRPRAVFLALDNDDAGRDATARIKYCLSGLIPQVVTISYEGKDPGSVSAAEMGHFNILCDAAQRFSKVGTSHVL